MHQATLAAINSSRKMFETPVVEQDSPRYGSPKEDPLLTRASIEIFH
jgi:hypothetical protein